MSARFFIFLALIIGFFSLYDYPVFADATCPDDLHYTDSSTNQCIYKHAGVADSSQPGGCRYAFDPVDAKECGGQPSPAPTQASTPTTPAPTSTLAPTPTGALGIGTSAEATPPVWTAQDQAGFTWASVPGALLCMETNYTGLYPCKPAKWNGTEVKVAFNGDPNDRGAMGTLASLVGTVYDAPPAATGVYLADMGQRLGLASPVYAQETGSVVGSGAGVIQPVYTLWKVMRNFSYLLFVFIFLIVGLMIMFRQKINPQTVVSVQAALPQLVISLILITFSYFIASFIIDISFFSVQLIAQIFSQAATSPVTNGLGDAQHITQLAQNSNLLDLFTSSFRVTQNMGDIFTGASNTIASIGSGANTLISGLIGGVIGGLVFSLPGFLAGSLIGGAAGAAGGPIGPGIAALLIPLVLITALLIQFIKLFFKLIYAYINLLLFTVFGPIILAYSAIPGRSGSVSFWWRTILAYSLVFPAVFAIFMFSGMILGTDPNAFIHTPPLFGGLRPEMIRIVIAYAFMVGSPAVPDMVTKALKVPNLGEIGTQAQQGFMQGFSTVQSTGNRLVGRYLEERKAYRDTITRERARDWAHAAGTEGGVPWYITLGMPNAGTTNRPDRSRDPNSTVDDGYGGADGGGH